MVITKDMLKNVGRRRYNYGVKRKYSITKSVADDLVLAKCPDGRTGVQATKHPAVTAVHNEAWGLSFSNRSKELKAQIDTDFENCFVNRNFFMKNGGA